MTNDQPENTGADANTPYNNNERNLRRVGRATRKDSLPPTPPLFPPDENEPDESAPAENAPASDHDRYKPPADTGMPAHSEDDEIQLPPPDFSLLAPDDNVAADLARSTDVMRSVTVTPQAERYPPLPDQTGALPASTPKRQSAPKTGERPSSPTRASAPQKTAPQASRRGFYNLLSLVGMLATFALCAVYSMIWLEPQSVLNPFPPEVQYVYITATFLPADEVIATPDAGLTAPDITSANDNLYPFALTSDGILHIPNGNGRGCEWASIAGSVLSAESSPLNGYRIRITDANGNTDTVFTGATLTFGEGGFEFPVADAPTNAEYTLQLFSPQDAPLSEILTVTTRATCEENIAVVILQEAP